MKPLICCPLGREENRDRVIAMRESQTILCDILFVTKKDAPTIGEARNHGIRHARIYGYEWVIQWDDDNYYGPEYVARILAPLSSRPSLSAITMGLGFVRNGPELWYFPKGAGFLPGHSTAVRAGSAHMFEHVSRGEDVQWSEVAILRCLRVATVDPWGLVYDRTGDGHAYDADATEFLRSFGPAVPLGRQPDSYVDTPKELPSAPLVRARDEAVFAMMERKLRLVSGAR